MVTYLLNINQQQSVLFSSTVLYARAYPPYGAINDVVGPGLGFCGEHRDPLTGNYPLGNGHRYYSPTLMRFLSPDKLSPFDRGGPHTYAYCVGDPVNRVDPSGAMPVWYTLLSRVISQAAGYFTNATFFGMAVLRGANAYLGTAPVTPRVRNAIAAGGTGAILSTAGRVVSYWEPATGALIGGVGQMFTSAGALALAVEPWNTAASRIQATGVPVHRAVLAGGVAAMPTAFVALLPQRPASPSTSESGNVHTISVLESSIEMTSVRQR